MLATRRSLAKEYSDHIQDRLELLKIMEIMKKMETENKYIEKIEKIEKVRENRMSTEKERLMSVRATMDKKIKLVDSTK